MPSVAGRLARMNGILTLPAGRATMTMTMTGRIVTVWELAVSPISRRVTVAVSIRFRSMR
jgi:hypothetical protein